MENQEKEKDNLNDIQNKMNAMDLVKRKKILVIFASVCVFAMLLKLAVSFAGHTRKEEAKADEEKARQEAAIAEQQQQVLEFSLEKKKRMNKNFEEILDRMVEEDRKESEMRNGESK